MTTNLKDQAPVNSCSAICTRRANLRVPSVHHFIQPQRNRPLRHHQIRGWLHPNPSPHGKVRPCFGGCPLRNVLLPESRCRRLCFHCRGIGVTPFLSMLRDIRERRLHRRVAMFWRNKREEGIICRKELDDMVSENPNIEIIHVLSRQEDYAGEKGHIDAEKLGRDRTRLQDAQYFILRASSAFKGRPEGPPSPWTSPKTGSLGTFLPPLMEFQVDSSKNGQ